MTDNPFTDISVPRLESLSYLQAHFKACSDKSKINLMSGVYKTDQGKPFVLPSVVQAKKLMFDDPTWNHEYPSSHLGTEKYREESRKLFFGPGHRLVHEERLPAMQALGASGANHMAALFLKLHYSPWKASQQPIVYIPQESWSNHPNVFSTLDIRVEPLPYYSRSLNAFDYDRFSSSIQDLAPQSVIVLQTCAQSPTGCDPSPDQWRKLAKIFSKSNHFAFFDSAYPGFVSGDISEDLKCIQIFTNLNVNLLVAATYGKCFGLYGERVGIMILTAPTREIAEKMEGQMKLLARAETGAQPSFGSRIVESILKDEGGTGLRRTWEKDLKEMAAQLLHRRQCLRALLEDQFKTPGDWHHVTTQVGMFLFLNLQPIQLELLREKYYVYLQDNGRLSVASLNSANIHHVAKAIDASVRESGNMHMSVNVPLQANI